MATTQFDRIYHALSPEVGSKCPGFTQVVSLRLSATAEFRIANSGMAWKGEDNEGVIALPAEEIKWTQWLRVARNFQLKVGLKDRRRETFDGFMREVRRQWWC